MKKKNGTIILCISVVFIMAFLLLSMALGEHSVWDCPDCGRAGNTGNYCGGCAHPAPWIDSATDREASFMAVGNIVTFGTYPQTKEGTDQTPIEWIVLDYDAADNKALLLSKYGLDVKQYNTSYPDITWEQCSLRAWLNDEFLKKAFSTEEQSAVLTTAVDNSKSQGYSGWNTDGGNNTQDRVFLLSYTEANSYLNVTYGDSKNINSRVAPTAYAIAKGAYANPAFKTADGEAAGWWWLRSPGYYRRDAARVNRVGSLSRNNVNSDDTVVRPAFWLDLESDIF